VRLTDAGTMLRRFWFVALAGALGTLGMIAVIQHTPGVYHEQVDVVFMWPQAPGNSENSLQYGTQTLIQTAGIVGTVVAGSPGGSQVVADTATAVGQGLRHGYSVRLPNAGGQWAYNFEDPVLRIESVGASPREVRATTRLAVIRVQNTLLRLQRDERVPNSLLLQTRLNPADPSIEYSGGSRIRAVAVTLILGYGLTIAALAGLAVRSRRRDALADAATDDGTDDDWGAPVVRAHLPTRA
jgi:hypothetical protein